MEGNRQIYYRAYQVHTLGDGSVIDIDNVNSVLDYCFQNVWFYGNEKGLTKISFGDVRIAGEEVGTYSILTEAEAMEQLMNGNCVSLLSKEDVKNGTFSEENIVEIELMYFTNSVCQYYQPYYCFYVELEQKIEGMVQYGCFYVPAVAEEYPFGN